MLADYEDIRKRISEPPVWFDENGVPRYDPFSPKDTPDIYASEAALLRIRCQACGERFLVGLAGRVPPYNLDRSMPLSEQARALSVGFHDPPRHGGCSGETMCSEALKVVEFWRKNKDYEWERVSDLEVALPDSGACD